MLVYVNGGFAVDQLVLTDQADLVPRGRAVTKGAAKAEPIYFSDDFMRENPGSGSNLGDWAVQGGRWQQYMIAHVVRGRKSSSP